MCAKTKQLELNKRCARHKACSCAMLDCSCATPACNCAVPACSCAALASVLTLVRAQILAQTYGRVKKLVGVSNEYDHHRPKKW